MSPFGYGCFLLGYVLAFYAGRKSARTSYNRGFVDGGEYVKEFYRKAFEE